MSLPTVYIYIYIERERKKSIRIIDRPINLQYKALIIIEKKSQEHRPNSHTNKNSLSND